jgi:hypothetical protein
MTGLSSPWGCIQFRSRRQRRVLRFDLIEEENSVKRVTPVVLAASALLVALDIIGALVRHPLGFPYSPLAIVCLLTYFTVGLLSAGRAGMTVGVAAAAIVGFLDSTLGPLVAWFVGRGPVTQTIEEPGIFVYGITVVTLTAAATGFLGAGIGLWIERRRGLRGSRVVPH